MLGLKYLKMLVPRKQSVTRMDAIQIWLSYFMRLSLLFAIGWFAFYGSWTLMVASSAVFVLTFVPSIIERNIKVNLPAEIEIFMLLFIYGTLFLGEVHKYYAKFIWWDVWLHSSSALMLGFVGFLILYVMYSSNRVQARPGLIATFAFCFAMAIGGVWEILEFAIQSLTGYVMQHGLRDTMWDLIFDAAGALIMSVAGYFYVKGAPSLVIQHLLLKFAHENPGLFGEDISHITDRRKKVNPKKSKK